MARRTWRPRHDDITTKSDAAQPEAETAVYLFDDWFDPIEAGLRDRVRDFIETMIGSELDAALGRPRYAGGQRGASDEPPPASPAIGMATAHAR